MEVRPSRKELRRKSRAPSSDVLPGFLRDGKALLAGVDWKRLHPRDRLGWASLGLVIIGLGFLGHVILVRHGAAVAQARMHATFEASREKRRLALPKVEVPTTKTVPPTNQIMGAAAMGQQSLPGYMGLQGTDSASVPAAGQEIAELTIPKITLDYIVTEGDSGLANGPVHVTHTALPGEAGNMVIAAHNALYFSSIGSLQPGDRITLLNPSGTKFTYIVVQSAIVPSSVSIPVYPYPASLTLESCYPLNGSEASSSQRYMVQARLAVPA